VAVAPQYSARNSASFFCEFLRTRTWTGSPRFSRLATRKRPMKPVAPVTKYAMIAPPWITRAAAHRRAVDYTGASRVGRTRTFSMIALTLRPRIDHGWSQAAVRVKEKHDAEESQGSRGTGECCGGIEGPRAGGTR